MHADRAPENLEELGKGTESLQWNGCSPISFKALRVREAYSLVSLRASQVTLSTIHCLSLDDTWHMCLGGVCWA